MKPTYAQVTKKPLYDPEKGAHDPGIYAHDKSCDQTGLSHHMTKHMTGHMIRQALSHHMILYVILGKNHLTSQGIGQEYSHVPFQGLDVQHVH